MADIEQFVRELNMAWVERRYGELHEYFHTDVVLLSPGTDEPVEGVEKIIDEYREFGSLATQHAFDITEVRVYEFGAVSLCHMRFNIDYEMDAGRMREDGWETYAIDTTAAGPRVVWRTQVPTPNEA